MSVLLSIEQLLQVFDAEAYHNGTVNGGEGFAVELADILAEPCFVYRWETEYGSEKADPNLDELIALFRSLDPATQKCALTQIKALNDLQKGH